MKLVITAIILITTISCGIERKQERQVEGVKKTGPGVSLTTQNPMILVHGNAPLAIAKLDRLKTFLVRKGFKGSDIHLPTYRWRQSLADLSKNLSSEFAKIFAKYPKGTKFDIVGHSFGDFIAMYSLAKFKQGKYVDKYIGLAGVAFGQNEGLAICNVINCPDYTEFLTPYKSQFIRTFWRDHGQEIMTWDHCAIYSTKDRRVTSPRDSGVIPGGQGFKVNDLSHLGFARNAKAVTYMMRYCLK